jgi:hypothetical protein
MRACARGSCAAGEKIMKIREPPHPGRIGTHKAHRRPESMTNPSRLLAVLPLRAPSRSARTLGNLTGIAARTAVSRVERISSTGQWSIRRTDCACGASSSILPRDQIRTIAKSDALALRVGKCRFRFPDRPLKAARTRCVFGRRERLAVAVSDRLYKTRTEAGSPPSPTPMARASVETS